MVDFISLAGWLRAVQWTFQSSIAPQSFRLGRFPTGISYRDKDARITPSPNTYLGTLTIFHFYAFHVCIFELVSMLPIYHPSSQAISNAEHIRSKRPKLCLLYPSDRSTYYPQIPQRICTGKVQPWSVCCLCLSD